MPEIDCKAVAEYEGLLRGLNVRFTWEENYG